MTINGNPVGTIKPVRLPDRKKYVCARCGRTCHTHVSQRSITGLCETCLSHRDDTPTRTQTWTRHAACIPVGWGLFFPTDKEHAVARQAKKVCMGCPVIRECLAYALTNNLRHGIYGGMTQTERLPLHQARKSTTP